MKCFYCNAEVRWNNDFDTEETYPESEHIIVSMYNCDESNAWYEVFHEKRRLNDTKTFVCTANRMATARQLS